MSGWLATQAAGPLLPSPDAVTYSVIAGEKTIDLTTIDTTKVDAVEIKAVASDVEAVAITVRDFGVGFAPEDAAHVFDVDAGGVHGRVVVGCGLGQPLGLDFAAVDGGAGEGDAEGFGFGGHGGGVSRWVALNDAAMFSDGLARRNAGYL